MRIERITAVIPCYNASKYINQCLWSVRTQTRCVDEIFVVDDCSTDESKRIIAGHPAVRLLTTQKNSGHATARNLGIREASGEVIAWLDADDFWEANHVETVVGLLEKHPDAAVAFSGVRLFPSMTNVWNTFPCEDNVGWILSYAMERTVVPAMSAVTRTEAIRAVGGYDESVRIAPDFDLWLRMSLIYKFVSTARVTSNYRCHGDQISLTKRQEQIASAIRSRFKVYKALLDAKQHEKARDLANVSLKEWTGQIWNAWETDDRQALRLFLSLSACVPGSEAVFRKYRRRLLIPAAMTPTLKWVLGLCQMRRSKLPLTATGRR